MTQDDLLDLLHEIALLAPASAQACAEAALLDFLWAEGYTTVVEAYLHVRDGRTITVEER
jgi:hypothetical protein